MSTPAPKTPDDVRRAFDDGTVVNASKEELEQLLLANGRARILHDANQARASEMGETMRQLLAARQSQELHDHATRIAVIALIISIASLLVSAAQLVLPLLQVRTQAAPAAPVSVAPATSP